MGWTGPDVLLVRSLGIGLEKVEPVELMKRAVKEAHRRSLWQVLSVYIVGSWVALQVAEVITESAGLPDWVRPFTLILLIIGLPLVLATAVVQEGVPGSGDERLAMTADPSPRDDNPGVRNRLFNWRNAITGGIGGFSLLGFSVGVYFFMWSSGLGPMGSLVAQGALSEGDQVVLADFQNLTPDPTLSSVVTEALRIDLATSRAITLADADAVRQAVVRMERNPSEPLTAELAREVAVRDGMKAILSGDVGAAGTGYILSATLQAAESGETLASFRRAAESPEKVIQAIDRLSQDIRERAGESLRNIRRGGRLEEVTTGSLDALRRFTEAIVRFDAGEESHALALLEEAVVLDSTFAMAHRKLAITLLNLDIHRERQLKALNAAFRHRQRLTERERLITEATYHHFITGDSDAIIRAYEGVLRIDPDDGTALNNLGNLFNQLEDYGRAEALYQRAVNGPGTSNTVHSNLVRTRMRQGDLKGARSAMAAFESAYPEDPLVPDRAFWLHAWAGEWADAEAALARWEASPDLNFAYRVRAYRYRAILAAAQGKMAESRNRISRAQELAAAELGPGSEWKQILEEARLEIGSGGTDRARSVLEALERRRLFDQVPLSARDYELAVMVHNRVGNASEARTYLRRWQEEVPPELAGRHDEAERDLHGSMVGEVAVDPAGVLGAIESYRVRLRCRRCYRIEEAQALEASGRLEEARDVWQSAASRVGFDFDISMLERAGAWERVGRLSEEMGDIVAALEGYRQFVGFWADADPEFQPRVRVARERMAALEEGDRTRK